MLIIISIIAILVFIAGYCNGEMDLIKKFNLDAESWLNKWDLDENGKVKPARYYKYYFGLFKPEHEEHFPYSSTILVFLTDAWHLMKWIMFTCLEASFMIMGCYLLGYSFWFIPAGIVILKTIRGLGFILKYDKK